MIYVIAIGAFQAFTGIFLLWKNSLRSKADQLLIFLLLCIATHLAIKFYIYTIVQDDHVRTQMNTFIGGCYGALLYLYALKSKDPSFIPASRWYVFLPFIAGAVGYLTVTCVLMLSPEIGHRALDVYNRFSTWFLIGNNIFFPLLALKIAKEIPRKPEQQLVNRISYAFLLLGAFSIILCVMGIPSAISHGDLFGRSVIYAVLLGICVMIIRYKLAPEEPVIVKAPVEIPLAEPAPTGRKTHLHKQEQERIWEQLESHLRHQKIFTDPELTLEKLAQALSISKHHLSETLNSYAGKSFYQYINECRIQYVLDQMRSIHEKGLPVNILVLAYNCGFKAKSSFNQYFKKITGVTPTEYYKSVSASAI